jgi:hypothetical protein
MMKRFLLLAVLAACGKPNEVKTLHHEAIVTAKYYQPQLDQLDKRLQTIFKRGTTIPGNLPGIEIVTPRLTEARDGIAQLRGIVGSGTGKSAVETQADAAAKAGKVADLEKLIADTEKTLSEGTTIIRDDLTTVENWIAQYEQGTNRAGGAPPSGNEGGGQQQPPAPAPAPGGNPAQPAAPTGAQPAAPATPPAAHP